MGSKAGGTDQGGVRGVGGGGGEGTCQMRPVLVAASAGPGPLLPS